MSGRKFGATGRKVYTNGRKLTLTGQKLMTSGQKPHITGQKNRRDSPSRLFYILANLIFLARASITFETVKRISASQIRENDSKSMALNVSP